MGILARSKQWMVTLPDIIHIKANHPSQICNCLDAATKQLITFGG